MFRRFAPLAVVACALGVLGIGLWFHGRQLPESPTLWTAVTALAVAGNGITAFLLWVRSRIAGSAGLAGIGSTYFYAAALGIPYLLTVPLMIGPVGPATYLVQAFWDLWHIGFPIGVLVTVVAVHRAPERMEDDRIDATLRRFKWWALGFSAIGIAAAAGYSQIDRSPLNLNILHALLIVLNASMVLAFLSIRPLYRALGPWICAALSTSGLEVLARLLAGNPYSVGWYAARVEMLLASVIVLVAMLADIDRVYRRMSRLVTHDYLTGLLNRATFEARFEVALGYATRNKTPLAVLIIDVDHFKGYNDRYGHMRGDRALQAVSAAIAASASRSSDVAGRLGGEEFALVIAVADLAGAQLVADRILATVSDGCITHEDEPSGMLSVSVGIGFDERPAMVDKGPLQEAADAALYDAKRSGRGRSAHRIIGQTQATPS